MHGLSYVVGVKSGAFDPGIGSFKPLWVALGILGGGWSAAGLRLGEEAVGGLIQVCFCRASTAS